MNAYELANKAEDLKTGEYGYVDGWMEEAADMLRRQADRIAELEKEIQKIVANAEFELDRAYTTPQIKELSDEEIRVFMAEMPHLTERKDLLMFARAILKKASEK